MKWYVYLIDDGIAKVVSDDTIRHSIADGVAYDSAADALVHFASLVTMWGEGGDYLGWRVSAYRVGTEEDMARDLAAAKGAA